MDDFRGHRIHAGMESCAHCGKTREQIEDSGMDCRALRALVDRANARRGHDLTDTGDTILIRRKPEYLPPH